MDQLYGFLPVFDSVSMAGLSKAVLPGIGVFQDYYQTHQLRHLSPSTVAWIPSLETFFMFVGVRFPSILRLVSVD